MTDNTRWRCTDCGDVSFEVELLKAQNPFDPRLTVCGCLNCKSVDHFAELCDEQGCANDASCGFPTKDGYRRTCGEHYRPLPAGRAK